MRGEQRVSERLLPRTGSPGRSHWEPAPPWTTRTLSGSLIVIAVSARGTVSRALFSPRTTRTKVSARCARRRRAYFECGGVEHGARLGCRVVPSSVGVLGGVRASEAGGRCCARCSESVEMQARSIRINGRAKIIPGGGIPTPPSSPRERREIGDPAPGPHFRGDDGTTVLRIEAARTFSA